MARWLKDHEFTDGVDASSEESFVEYGLLRNPSNGLVITCRLLRQEGEERFYRLGWTQVSLEEVKADLSNIDSDFLNFIDSSNSSTDDICARLRQGLRNDYIAIIIIAINDWNGLYEQSDLETDGMTVDGIKQLVLGYKERNQE